MIGISNVSLASGALVLAKSSLLLALGYAIARLLHRAPAAARHVAWLTAIVGVLLVPVFDRFTPLPVHVLPASAVESVLPSMPPSVAPPSAVVAVAPHSVPTLRAVSPASFELPRITPLRLSIAIWAIVAFILVLRLVLGLASVGRLTRRSRVLDSDDWQRALDAATRQLAIPSAPRLVMSDEVEMAFAFDAVAPTIVLPASADEWSPERRRSVLLHELAHIRRRDLIGHAVAGLACAVNWFNPFIWIAARQLRVESELACDEIVLGAGVRPSVYAQHLLDMVTSVSRRAPTVALAMARPKEFEGRLVAILEPARRRGVVARRQAIVVAGLLAVSTISIGAIAPVPRRHAAPSVAASAKSSTHTDNALTAPASRVTAVDPAPTVRLAAHDDGSRSDTRTQASMHDVHAITEPASAADVSARLSNVAVDMLLRYGTSAIMNPMMMLLREADTLQLTGAQADSIATLNRMYTVQLSHLWRDVSAYYVAPPQIPNERSLNAGARAARQTSQLLIRLLPALDGLLTPQQRARLSPITARFLDARQIESAVTDSPTGVFVSERELFGLLGRGRRGGGGGGGGARPEVGGGRSGG